MFCFSTVSLIHHNNIVCCNEQGIYFISCISRSRKWLCQLSSCVDLDQISFSTSWVEIIYTHFTQHERGSSILKLMQISFVSKKIIFLGSIGLYFKLRTFKWRQHKEYNNFTDLFMVKECDILPITSSIISFPRLWI